MTIKSPTLNDVMNSIRSEASPTYQDRIPELNDSNFREFATGMKNPVLFNEWANALLNRIGISVLKNKAWKNPLAPLKKGELTMGSTIQEIFVDLIQAKKWRSSTTEKEAGRIYKSEPPTVSAAYYTVNRTDVYELSYNTVEINRAFVDAGTLTRFIDNLYTALDNSDQFDEYLYMKELMTTYDERGLFHYINVAPLEELELTTFIASVKSLSNKLTFMSDKYTGLQVTTHAKKEDQLIYISTDLDAIIDVNVLASAFNMDKAQFLAKRVLLDEMPVKDALLIVASKDWLQVWESVRELRVLPIQDTLEMKLFYHVHQAMFTSLFEPAVVFTTAKTSKPKTVEISTDVLEADGKSLKVKKGQFITLPTTVKDGKGSATNVNQAVLFSKTGATAQTRFEGNRLYVDLMEGDEFFILVSALHDKEVNKEYKVIVE